MAQGRAGGAATGIVRVLAAGVVVLLFFSTLVAATAQQTIASALQTLGGERTLGYSEALSRWQDLRRSDEAQTARRQAVQDARGAIQAGDVELEDLRTAEARVRGEARELIGDIEARSCASVVPDSVAPAELARLLTKTQRCLRRLRPPSAEAAQVTEASRQLALAVRDLEKQVQALTVERARLDSLEVELAQAAGSVDGAAEGLRAAFQDYAFIQRVGLLEWLVSAPPFLTQLLLVTVSGAFGAVLVLLIVLVYPDNEISLARGEGFFARIALGSIVAIAFYVILTSGVAVIQGDPGIASDANVMAFALVGLLAGAFANKVARWLTNHSDSFLGIDSLSGRTGGSGSNTAA